MATGVVEAICIIIERIFEIMLEKLVYEFPITLIASVIKILEHSIRKVPN